MILHRSKYNARHLLAALCFASGFGSTVLAADKLPSVAQVTVDFARDIQPLLAKRCYECHGASKQKNGLRLDRKAEAFKGGESGPAFVPGKSRESRLIHNVAGLNPDTVMPQKGERLSAEQIGLLRAWIDQGAVWPDTDPASNKTHWAFVSPVRPAARPVKNKKWVRNPIDNFVLARLGKERLAPSPEADRVTLIRRLSLDLTGLPPSPQEVDEFLADKNKNAYAQLVERLLASPHYGERWGRHWLDAARYADSNGFEKDRTRSIWPYRDWVINAFNRDLPFDQFTVEQLAGDLLPNATLDQRLATGFLRNSMVNMEGGVEPEKFRTEVIIDRVDAVGRTWLGLTIACCQCHNHKYDPITQAEYYQFYAFLNQDDEPRLEVPTHEEQARRDQIHQAVRAQEDKLLNDAGIREKFAAWEQRLAAVAGDWQPLDAKEWHCTPMKFEKQEDFSLLAGGDIYNTGVLRVWVDTVATNLTGFRLEALNNANLPFNGPGLDAKGDFLITEFTVEATPLRELTMANPGGTNFVATTNRIVFRRAVADWESPEFPASKLIDGVTTNGGWASAFGFGRRNQERRVVFETAQPAGFEGGTRLLLTVNCKPSGGLQVNDGQVSNFIVGRVRLSATTQAGPLAVDPLNASQRRLLAIPTDQRTPDQQHELFQVFLFQEPSLAGAAKERDALWQNWPVAETTTLVLQSRPVPRRTRIFKRGDWQRPTTEVTAAIPAVLPPLAPGAPKNRLGLARWLVSTNNPLTARVIVNRVWQQYFGTGLVPTPEDFGARAENPSHPELLDWLASEFMQRGWSFKELHRLIASSSTYQQSSRVTPALLNLDPYNRLLARGPRLRVDAEIVQDIALRAAGLLSPKIGGPSVFPPLPDGVMSFAYGPIPWNVSEGDDRYRRAMYTFWKRSVPYPALILFDAPAAEQSCVRRTRSNTPLQALTTLNEPTFNNAARWLAWRALKEGGPNDEARASLAFRLCVARQPEPKELQALLKLLEVSLKDFAAQPKDAMTYAFADPKNPAPLPAGVTSVQLAAWTAVSRAILNLDETLTKE